MMYAPLVLLTLLQAHPCDAPDLSGGQAISNQVLSVYWCSPEINNIDAATIYVNGGARFLSAIERVTPLPNATGEVEYRVVLGTMARGTYTIELTAWNRTVEGVAQESPRSSPFLLSVADPAGTPAPAAPRIKAVRP
jgi:hypothetical protein